MKKARRIKDYAAESIAADVFVPVRTVLAARIEALGSAPPGGPPVFSEDDLEQIFDHFKFGLPDPVPFLEEMENVRAALETGRPLRPPHTGREETQILWGAALLAVQANLDSYLEKWGADSPEANKKDKKSKPTIRSTPLWAEVTGAPHTQAEKLREARYVTDSMRKKGIRFRWGPGGSDFGYDAASNVINIDLIQSLCMGFVHARAGMMKQAEATRISTDFPPRLKALRADMVAIRKAHEQSGRKSMDEEAYKRLRLLSAEWQLRHTLYQAAEGNALHRQVVARGRYFMQDHAYSLNYGTVTSTNPGRAIQFLRELQAQESSLRALFNRVAAGDTQDLDAFLRQQGEDINDQNRQALTDYLGRQLEDIGKQRKAHVHPPPVPPDAYSGFRNVIDSVMLAFFRNNHLFDGSREESWKEMGVRPGWIRRRPDDLRPSSTPADDFSYLMDLCSGQEGLENLRPSLKQAWYQHVQDSLAADYTSRRNEVIEHIWDEYLADYARAILEKVEEQVDKEIEQSKQEQKNQQGSEQEQEGQDQEGQDQQGQGQGQGQGKGQGKGKGKPGKNQKQDKNKKKDGDKSDQGQESDEESQEQDGDQGQQSKQKKDKSQKGDKNERTDQDDQDAGPESEQESGHDQGGQDSDQPGDMDPAQMGVDKSGRKLDVESEDGKKSSMPDVQMPPESPQDPQKKKGRDGQNRDSEGEGGDEGDGEGDGEDGDDGDAGGDDETLEEMIEKMRQRQQGEGDEADQDGEGAEADGDGAEADGQGTGSKKGGKGKQKGKSSPKDGGKGAGEGGRGRKLSEIAQQDWENYPAVVAQLQGYIHQVASLLAMIQKRQIEKESRRSERLSALPEDNDLSRLNQDAHRSLVMKLRTGQNVEESDINRFHVNRDTVKPAQIDIVLLIDGSGSMTSGNRPQPLDIALISSTILYEAAKRINANVYIMMWGSDNPVMIARPGDDPREIGPRIVAAKKGLSSGTDMATSIRKISGELANPVKKASPFSGYTHALVLSDGDISDKEPTKKMVNILFGSSKYVTLDFAIIKDKNGRAVATPMGLYVPVSQGATDMEKVAHDLRAQNPVQRITSIRDMDGDQMPVRIIGMILDKIIQNESFRAIPRERKQESFRRAYLKMNLP